MISLFKHPQSASVPEHWILKVAGSLPRELSGWHHRMDANP